MAEESNQSKAAPEDGSINPKNLKKKSNGFFSRIWKSTFGSGDEDFEKKLQCLSKEEASVHARLKRRARSSRKKVRNIIVVSVILEVIAVVYAIITTRSVNLDWKTRAARVFPMFGLPLLSTLIYSTLVSFTRMLDRKDQKTLERLRAERQAKIDELKERTNYYTTQQLIQRYDLDPAAKAAAATVLASKLGADSGLKVYLGDESNPKASLGRSNDSEIVNSTGLRNRKPSHMRSNSTGNAALTQLIDEPSVDYSSDGQEVSDQNQRVVEHYKGPSSHDGGWLARIAALLVGEDPTQCYALICGNCHMHNGLARKEEFPFVTYYCPNCQALNGAKQSADRGPELSSGQAAPAAPLESSSSVSSNLAPVEELPELPDGDGDEDQGEGEARAS